MGEATQLLDKYTATSTNLDKFTGEDGADDSELCGGGVRFEWRDSPLLRAFKRGDWLLVEDANCCRSTNNTFPPLPWILDKNTLGDTTLQTLV